jgi:hypothetical protein
MPSIIDDWVDEAVTHRIDLLRFSEDIRFKALGYLKELESELRDQIFDRDIRGVASTAWRKRRQEALLKQARASIRKSYKNAQKVVDGQLIEVASLEQSFAIQTMIKISGAELFSAAFSPTELAELTKGTLIQGAPSADWWAKQADNLRMGFESQVRMGVLAGETNQEITQRIIGTSTGKYRTIEVGGKTRRVAERVGGIMDTSKREATALVRTSVQNVSNATQGAVFEANNKMLRGIEAVVTLDDRTTLLCMSRIGGAWDMEGNPLPDSNVSESFPGYPPWHWNCRTIMVPVIKTWDELADMVEKETGQKSNLRRFKKISPATQASMDGQLAGEKAKSFFTDKIAADPDFGRKVLGPCRYELWKEGKVTSMSQMVDPTGRRLTLRELKDKLNINDD